MSSSRMDRKLSSREVGFGQTEAPAALQVERDRFAALAFCAADVLFELDPELRVVFAGGATSALIGQAPDALRGKYALDLFVPQDRPMMREALNLAAQGRRLGLLTLRLEGPTGPTAPLALLGCHLPDMGGHYFLTLRLGTQGLQFGAEEMTLQIPGGDTGLPNARSFAILAAERLAAPGASAQDEQGRTLQLSLLKLRGLDDLRRRLDRAVRDELASCLAGSLRAWAMDGDLVGQFGSETFGLIHTEDADIATLEGRIIDLAQRLDPKQADIAFSRSAVEVDVANMGESEQVKALVHVVNRFVDGEPEDFAIDSLTSGLSAMIGETVHKIGEFRSIVSTSSFAMAFQPIVSLDTGKTHHYEVLARFTSLGNRLTPYEAITFAEQTGLICDFDLAMCAKALGWLEAQRRDGRTYNLAVNLSGSSIGTPAFVKALHKLLKTHEALRHQVLFEITESARILDLRGVNVVLRGLRAEGHKVCLDDFGAGAAAFHYLRALDVDLVKIDGVYVRDALKSSKGAAFLKAMAGLCNDLGIATAAEMVEDAGSVAFLQQCGVEYGQGYLFGRPSLDVRIFEAPAGGDHNLLRASASGPARHVVGPTHGR